MSNRIIAVRFIDGLYFADFDNHTFEERDVIQQGDFVGQVKFVQDYLAVIKPLSDYRPMIVGDVSKIGSPEGVPVTIQKVFTCSKLRYVATINAPFGPEKTVVFQDGYAWEAKLMEKRTTSPYTYYLTPVDWISADQDPKEGPAHFAFE